MKTSALCPNGYKWPPHKPRWASGPTRVTGPSTCGWKEAEAGTYDTWGPFVSPCIQARMSHHPSLPGTEESPRIWDFWCYTGKIPGTQAQWITLFLAGWEEWLALTQVCRGVLLIHSVECALLRHCLWDCGWPAGSPGQERLWAQQGGVSAPKRLSDPEESRAHVRWHLLISAFIPVHTFVLCLSLCKYNETKCDLKINQA